MTRLCHRFWVVLVTAAASACVPPAMAPPATCNAVPANARLIAPLEQGRALVGSSSAVAHHDSISLTLEVPSRVNRGEPVPFELRVWNPTERQIRLDLSGNPPNADFVVTGPGGAAVWSRLHERARTLALMDEVLQPGEMRWFRASWGQEDNLGCPVDPGSYRVEGVLPTVPGSGRRTDPQTLTILP